MDSDALAAHIRALEERLLDPAVRRDREAAGRLLDPAFREVGSSGRTFDRDGVLDALAAETGDAPGLVLADFSLARLGPDAVLATYRAAARAGAGGRASRPSLRCSVWVRRRGDWRLLFHQGTPVATGP